MPRLVVIGPAVQPAIGNRQTDKPINKQTYRLLYVRLGALLGIVLTLYGSHCDTVTGNVSRIRGVVNPRVP